MESINLSNKIYQLPDIVKYILIKAGELADELHCNLYLVGGFVRDILLNTENTDIDIVVESDGIFFAYELAKLLDGEVETHEKFRTAKIKIDNSLEIDVVTARKEYYEYPAVLPTVEIGTIKDDLFRRDFTINSMAVKLNKHEFGQLLDFFGGQEDLDRGLIRILHDLSFIDDPTRLFRAVRYEQRYYFHIEEKTLQLALNAVNSDMINELSRDRINNEVYLIFNENNAANMIERMYKLKILSKTFQGLEFCNEILGIFNRYDKEFFKFEKNYNLNKPLNKTLINFLILFSSTTSSEFECINRNIKLIKSYAEQITKFIYSREQILLSGNNFSKLTKYEIYNLFRRLSLEAVFTLTLMKEEVPIKTRVEEYILNLKDIKVKITGNDLKKLGIEPGPIYKEVLENVLKARINGEISSDKELEYAKKIIKKE